LHANLEASSLQEHGNKRADSVLSTTSIWCLKNTWLHARLAAAAALIRKRKGLSEEGGDKLQSVVGALNVVGVCKVSTITAPDGILWLEKLVLLTV
jgi:hypothetical protein